MYFWNIHALRRGLQKKRLPEPEVFSYFLAVLMLEAVIWELGTLLAEGAESDGWDYVGVFGNLALTLAGTVLAYRANGGAAGRQFIERYFPVFWVLTIRFLVWTVPLFAVAGAAYFILWPGDTDADTGGGAMQTFDRIVMFAGWGLLVLFYYRLYVHLRFIARTGRAATPSK